MNRVVVVGVVVRDGAVLLVRRRAGEKALSWQFPGGAVQTGEDAAVAVCREVREETGVRCRPVAELGVRTHPDTRRRIAYWVCTWLSGDPVVGDPAELDRVEWVCAAEVAGRITSDLYPPIAAVLARVAGCR